MNKEKTKVNKFFTKLTHKGVSLIVLIVTIIVVIILAAVIILTINKNNPVESAKKAVLMSDIDNIQNSINLQCTNTKETKYLTGKLNEFDIDSKYIEKYNDILYVKNNKVYLDFVSTISTNDIYINNKNTVEILKESLEICYDGIKEYNKLVNPSFDEGLTGYSRRETPGNKTEVLNENGNNFVRIEMHVSSGNTQYIMAGKSKIASKYGDKCYACVKYRNCFFPKEDGFVINNKIIVLSRYQFGFEQSLLDKVNFLNSYNLGWIRVSTIRQIESRTSNLGLCFRLGGGPANGQTQEYTVDFDDIYIINLTELFGEGNEPSKSEMDSIFDKIV